MNLLWVVRRKKIAFHTSVTLIPFILGILGIGCGVARSQERSTDTHSWPGLAKLWRKSQSDVVKVLGKPDSELGPKTRTGLNNGLHYTFNALTWNQITGVKSVTLYFVNGKVSATAIRFSKTPNGSNLAHWLGVPHPVVIDATAEERHGMVDGKAWSTSLASADEKLFPCDQSQGDWADTDALNRNELTFVEYEMTRRNGPFRHANDYVFYFSRKPIL